VAPGSIASSLLSDQKLRAILENARQILKVCNSFLITTNLILLSGRTFTWNYKFLQIDADCGWIRVLPSKVSKFSGHIKIGGHRFGKIRPNSAKFGKNRPNSAEITPRPIWNSERRLYRISADLADLSPTFVRFFGSVF